MAFGGPLAKTGKLMHNSLVIDCASDGTEPAKVPALAPNGDVAQSRRAGNPCGFLLFWPSGRGMSQLMGQCRGRTHIPMALHWNPCAAELHSYCENEQCLPTCVWPTTRVLDSLNVSVLRTLAHKAGEVLKQGLNWSGREHSGFPFVWRFYESI